MQAIQQYLINIHVTILLYCYFYHSCRITTVLLQKSGYIPAEVSITTEVRLHSCRSQYYYRSQVTFLQKSVLLQKSGYIPVEVSITTEVRLQYEPYLT